MVKRIITSKYINQIDETGDDPFKYSRLYSANKYDGLFFAVIIADSNRFEGL